MSKRTRIHPVQFYLNDNEQYILEEKYRLSRMKSKSAFLSFTELLFLLFVIS